MLGGYHGGGFEGSDANGPGSSTARSNLRHMLRNTGPQVRHLPPSWSPMLGTIRGFEFLWLTLFVLYVCMHVGLVGLVGLVGFGCFGFQFCGGEESDKAQTLPFVCSCTYPPCLASLVCQFDLIFVVLVANL